MEDSPVGFSTYSKLIRYNGESEPGREGRDERVSNGRFFDVTELWLSDFEPGECIPTGQNPGTKVTRGRFSENSLLLRRIVKSQRTPQLQLEIQSLSLQQAFREATQGRATSLSYGDPIIIQAPYYELYHFRPELEAALAAARTERLRRELQLFRDFEGAHLSRTLKLAQVDDHKRQGHIRFEHLWSLFKPYDLIVLHTHTTPRANRACAVVRKYWVDADNGRWFIEVHRMSFDGSRFGIIKEQFFFPIFTGVVPINSLGAYPLSYSENQAAVIGELKTRGRAFIRLCKDGQDGRDHASGCLRDYRGPVWVEDEPFSRKGTGFFDAPKNTVQGRVLVDPKGFADEEPHLRPRIISGKSLRDPENCDDSDDGVPTDPTEQVVPNTEDLAEDDLICFPTMIAGYSLATKHVGFFAVDDFQDVTWEEDEAGKLFGSSKKMRAVHQVISGYSSDSHSFGYSIGGKGKGLVFLFFGPSGTGKTLTAECVAEILHRPLYRISGSDLGSEPSEIEDKLLAAFRRISRWKAILLLDEADAFMAKRSDDSLERNTLVAILLRLLEYQSGIVILTTNRQSHFDTAFSSRIHLTINFPALTSAEREVIWRSYGKKAASSSLSDDDFASLSRLDMDGRRIKNAFHVAELYARAGSGTGSGVSLADLKEVLQISLGDVGSELRAQLERFCGGGPSIVLCGE